MNRHIMKPCGKLSLLLLVAGAEHAVAQFAPPPPPAPAAVVLPNSGRNNQGGSVNATEQPVPGTTTSVNTLNTNVQVSGPYSGSMSSVRHIPFNGRLSLADALKRGLAYNLGAIGAAQSASQTGAQLQTARSALLPNLNGALSETVEQVDLAALGVRFNVPPAFAGLFRFPTVQGPFNYFNLEGSLSQNLVNLVAIHNYRSARASDRASRSSVEDARDLIALAVGGTYLQVLAAQARADAAQVQLDTANAVFQQSSGQHAQGVLGKLNVDQNQVRALTQQQQLITLRNDLAKQKINLARLVGLPPNPLYELSDRFPYSPAPVAGVEEAVARAERERPDLKAAQGRVDAAARALAAARAERLPSLALSGDYQVIGTNPAESHGAFAVVGTLSIPIWQGGRVSGDIAQARAALAQRQAELEDTRSQIEAEVREVYLDLEAAAGQVEVARKNVDVAQETLEMARERMQAGVVNTLEVVQAQQTLSSAQLDLINSIFAHNLAKLSLARALGRATDQLPSLLTPQPTTGRQEP